MSTSVTCTSTKAVEIRWEKGSSRGFFKLFQFLSLSCTFVRTSKLKVKTRDRARYSELQYSVSNQKGNMIKLKEKKNRKQETLSGWQEEQAGICLEVMMVYFCLFSFLTDLSLFPRLLFPRLSRFRW